jgi:hypothetical protein
VEAEVAIEVDDFLLRNRDGRAKFVIFGVTEWGDDVETIGGAALEDSDENFFAASAFGGKRRAAKPQRRGPNTGHRQRGVAKENSAIHDYFL